MANSLRITDLSSYERNSMAADDLFLVSSKKSGNYESYKLKYDELYNALLADISAALKSTWENPGLIQNIPDLINASTTDNVSGLGVQLGKEIINLANQLSDNLSCARWS